ncbi:MAG: tyrosine-protein phosphatase [Ottowia sp.]|nr:tyrosine-protein phosphatase [Ottowia sp.]
MMPPAAAPDVPNCRELGGIPAAGGRRVRRGVLWRSGSLFGLGASSKRQLEALGITRVIDLRVPFEREWEPDTLFGARTIHLPIEPLIARYFAKYPEAPERMTASEMMQLMQATYRDFITGQAARFAAFFAHLLEGDGTPLLFHCTAGKDRTGMAAALLLLALGASPQHVMHDYLQSAAHCTPPPDAAGADEEMLQLLWGVHPDYLRAALHEITRLGGADAYLLRALRVGAPERERLRALYLGAA